MVKGLRKKRFLRSKIGSEAVETSLVSIGLLLIGAVLVVIFVLISSSIFSLFHKKEAQSTGESFKFLVSKVELLNNPAGLPKVDHAYYVQSCYYLFGFNKAPDQILYRDGVLAKPTAKCKSSEACLCVCDTKDCNKENGKVIDCNININGERVDFGNIDGFAVVNDKDNKFTQGGDIESGKPWAGGKYLAIYGAWGGLCSGCGVGFGCHCWSPGTIMHLERKGSMIEVSFP